MLILKIPFQLFIFLLCALAAQSQQSGHYAFMHYRLAHGLASNIVNNVVQDEKGFLWLATNNGLQRFDGNRFITFKSDRQKQAALPDDEIGQVYLDRKQNLWVFTVDNKVGLWDTRSFRYTEVPLGQWHSENTYAEKNIVETADGKLLLYIKKWDRVFEYDTLSKKFASAYIILPHGWKLNSLVQEKATHKLLMTTDSGFAVFNPATRVLSRQGANLENDSLIVQLGSEKYLNYIFADAGRRLFYEQWFPASRHPVLKEINLETASRYLHDLTKAMALSKKQGKRQG